jgi:GNAT superfamily N-acetyltransferase
MKSDDFTWELRFGTSEDVKSALEQVNDDMDEGERQRRVGKLHGCARESDQELILATRDDRILGYLCVVEYDEPPSDLPGDQAEKLKDYACGTQLHVHPQFRKRGIGTSLLLEAEGWARKRGKRGFWMITHRRGYWYKRDFGYEELGKIWAKETHKTVLAKGFG